MDFKYSGNYLSYLKVPVLWYDMEVLPNLTTLIFAQTASDRLNFVTFKLSAELNDSEILAAWLNQILGRNKKLCLVGFNNTAYDDHILNHILVRCYQGKQANAASCYHLSSAIINGDWMERDQLHLQKTKQQALSHLPYFSIDLFQIMGGRGYAVGLKQAGLRIGWGNVLEFEFPFDQRIPQKLVPDLIKYNQEDVHLTYHLGYYLRDQIAQRWAIGKQEQLNLFAESELGIAKKILTRDWKALGHPVPFQTTIRNKIRGIDLVPSNCEPDHFTDPKLVAMVHRLLNSTLELRENKYGKKSFYYEDQVVLNGVRYSLGTGGLHSKDKGGFWTVKGDSSRIIVDVDVTSYYPNIIQNLEIVPDHIQDGRAFLDLLDRYMKDRIKAKASGDKTRAALLKIVILAQFGMLKSQNFWLYDPLAFYKVTLAGQLYLFKLIDLMLAHNIEPISANTDGVLCLAPNEKLLQSVCKQWEDENWFQLEYDPFVAFVRTNISNYAGLRQNGTIKTKGQFIQDRQNLNKAFKHRAIYKALMDYYFYSVPIEDSLRSEDNDLFDYMISEGAGSEMTVLQADWLPQKEWTKLTMDERISLGSPIQSTLRYIVTKTGVRVFKFKRNDLYKSGFWNRSYPPGKEPLTIVNNIDDPKLENWRKELNYSWYISYTQDLIKKIDQRK